MKLWLQQTAPGELDWLSAYLDFDALQGIVGTVPEGEVADGYLLQMTDSGLMLRSLAGGNARPTQVNFGADKLRHRVATTRRNEGLAKAVGLDKAPDSWHVLDATAGLGVDGFLLAAKGCRVTLLEKHPVMAALLADGLQRGLGEPVLADAVARMHLYHADAHQYLAQLTPAQAPEVIYLDPMFPPRQKSARVKKDMALMQELLPANDDVDALLMLACARARKRVVLKRPGKADRKADKSPAGAPDFQVPGKSCHFQVFLTAR